MPASIVRTADGRVVPRRAGPVEPSCDMTGGARDGTQGGSEQEVVYERPPGACGHVDPRTFHLAATGSGH